MATGVNAFSIWMNDTVNLRSAQRHSWHPRQIGRVAEDERAREQNADRQNRLDVDFTLPVSYNVEVLAHRHRDPVKAVHEVRR